MRKVNNLKKIKKELKKSKYGDKVNYKTILYILENMSGKKINYETLIISSKEYLREVLYEINFSEMPYSMEITNNSNVLFTFLDKMFVIQRNYEAIPPSVSDDYYSMEYIYLKECGLYIKKTIDDSTICRLELIGSLEHIIRMMDFEDSFYYKNKEKTKTIEDKHNDDKIYNNTFINAIHMVVNNRFIQLILLIIIIDIGNVIGGIIWFVSLILFNKIDEKHYINEVEDSYDNCISENVFEESVLSWICRTYKDIPFDIWIGVQAHLHGNNVDEFLGVDLNNISIDIKNNKLLDSISDKDKVIIKKAVDEYLTKQNVESQFSIKL